MPSSKVKEVTEISSNEEDEYEVGQVLEHRRNGKNGQLEYWVSWVGYGPDDNSWITEEDASGAADLVNAYWHTLPEAEQWQRTETAHEYKIRIQKEKAEKRKSGRTLTKARKSDRSSNGHDAKRVKRSQTPVGKDEEGLESSRHDLTYKSKASWEDVVDAIVYMEKDNSIANTYLFAIRWKEDSTYTWVTSDFVKKKCPLKLIEFYERNLKFTYQ